MAKKRINQLGAMPDIIKIPAVPGLDPVKALQWAQRERVIETLSDKPRRSNFYPEHPDKEVEFGKRYLEARRYFISDEDFHPLREGQKQAVNEFLVDVLRRKAEEDIPVGHQTFAIKYLLREPDDRLSSPSVDPTVTLPPGCVPLPGTVLPHGTVLPRGTVFPLAGIPAWDVLPPAVVDPSVTLPQGLALPPGTVIPAGTVLPPGTVIVSGYQYPELSVEREKKKKKKNGGDKPPKPHRPRRPPHPPDPHRSDEPDRGGAKRSSVSEKPKRGEVGKGADPVYVRRGHDAFGGISRIAMRRVMKDATIPLKLATEEGEEKDQVGLPEGSEEFLRHATAALQKYALVHGAGKEETWKKYQASLAEAQDEKASVEDRVRAMAGILAVLREGRDAPVAGGGAELKQSIGAAIKLAPPAVVEALLKWQEEERKGKLKRRAA